MDVTGPRYTATAADLGSTLGLLQALTDPATDSPDPSQAPRTSDFQTMAPETKAILSTIIDLLSGKFGSNFAVDYEDADGNADSIRKSTLLPGVFEFESGKSDTQVAATAFGPDAEMHIVTKDGNDVIQAMANNLRIATGAGNDAVKADANYLAAALAGDGDDAMYLSGGTLGDILGGAGNDAIDAWGNFVGNVAGDAGEDELQVGGRQIWFVDGGDDDDKVSVAATASSSNAGGFVTDVGGGNGNDTISVSGTDIGTVHGDDGDDEITVEGQTAKGGSMGGHVGSVDGGAGNDVISVSALQVDSVTGGEGDDTITIDTRPGLAASSNAPVQVRGGAGSDTMTINGAADIYFGLGDGQDSMTLTGGGRIILSDSIELDPSMKIERSGSMLQISFDNGDGLILDIGTEDQMRVSLKDNVVSITPIMTALPSDETA